MLLRNTRLRTSLWLGMSWSLLWSLVLSNLPFTQQLDLWQQDALTRLNRSSTPPKDIVLVTLKPPDLTAWDLAKAPTPYANLAKRLLDAGAAVVVLNLLPNWVKTSDHPNNPIKTLIQNSASRIVVVLPTTPANQPNPTAWHSYEYFLPLTDSGNPRYPPESILGFSESEPEAKTPLTPNSTARQANLSGQFSLTRQPSQLTTLTSAALLSLSKWNRQAAPNPPFHLPKAQPPVQIRFWGPTGTFPRLTAESVLNQSPATLPVRHTIVLVGFSDVNNPESFAIRSPFGELMPAVELQANLLASLITGTYWRIVPLGLQIGLVLLGDLLLSSWIVFGTLHPPRKPYRYWLWPLIGLGGFGLLGLLLWSQGWLLPIALPLFAWAATGVSVWISLRLGIQKDLIAQQQCELDRLHTVEQAAILSQAQKALRRLAAHIHEGPLQELKLVMDRLELLQASGSGSGLDPVLDQLTRLGHHLRQQLNQARTISLEITPSLKSGLAAGIEAKLRQLQASGQLTLRVIQQLQPLDEPLTSSLWLAAREDIYQVFVEAMTNVIRHAQPPQGSATQVKVTLGQTGSQCKLTVENDGDVLDPAVLQPPRFGPGPGKYGLQLMQTLTADLPQGQFTWTALESGGLRIALSWLLAAEP